jgi:hypothetical protein
MRNSVPGAAGRPSRLRSFDPGRIADLEYRAWVAYYRRQWLQVLAAAVGLVHAGFGMDWRRTLHGAWLVLRANQLWAPASGNDPAGARRCMRRFYALVRLTYGEPQDPAEAARLEVDWWRAHRERQRGAAPSQTGKAGATGAGEAGATGAGKAGATGAGEAGARGFGEAGDDLVDAVTQLYAFLYREPGSEVRPAAAHRARAMEISDQWVAEGRHSDSPLLALEHAALVRSYSALLAAVHH